MGIFLPTMINGVSGNFWLTQNIYISPDYSHSRVRMQLFTSQASYLSGSPALYGNDYLLSPLTPFRRVSLASLSEPSLITNVGQFAGGTYVSGI